MRFDLIYKTTNLINEKIYVGRHVQYDTSAFDGYLGSGVLITRAIEKYGEENFVREIIENVTHADIVNEREIFWIAELSATDRNIGYNIFPGGGGFTTDYMENMWRDPEIREKIIKGLKRTWSIKEVKQRRSLIMKDSLNRPEYKEKCSKRSKEKWQESSYREKSLLAFLLTWTKPEVKENHSKAMKEVWDSEEYRNKIREMRKRPEIIEKFSKGITEALNKPEYKEKRSELTKNDWLRPEYREKQHKSRVESWNRPGAKEKRTKRYARGIKHRTAIFHYVLKSPTGEVFETDCLKEFCNSLGMDHRNLSAVCNGIRKSALGGWTCISKTLREP